MRVEVTDRIFRGRCEVRTEWCRARACGSLGAVATPDGRQINVCGACVSQMTKTGAWTIPGTRPAPWPTRQTLDQGDTYTPNRDAIKVEPRWVLDRGRCEVRTEWCEATECGPITSVTAPDCRDIRLCGACLERMAVSGVWDLGRHGGAAVASMKRLAAAEAAPVSPAA